MQDVARLQLAAGQLRQAQELISESCEIVPLDFLSCLPDGLGDGAVTGVLDEAIARLEAAADKLGD